MDLILRFFSLLHFFVGDISDTNYYSKQNMFMSGGESSFSYIIIIIVTGISALHYRYFFTYTLEGSVFLTSPH